MLNELLILILVCFFFSFDFFLDMLNTGFPGEVPCALRAPLVVTFVGLPCRGKSLAAHKIARHLNWKGESAKGMCLI